MASEENLAPAGVAETLLWLRDAGDEEVELALPLDIGRARRDTVVGGVEEFVRAYPKVSSTLTERPLDGELLRLDLTVVGPARDLEPLVDGIGGLLHELDPDAAEVGITARRL